MRQTAVWQPSIVIAVTLVAGQLMTCLLQHRESIMAETVGVYYTCERQFSIQIKAWSWPAYYTQVHVVLEILW